LITITLQTRIINRLKVLLPQYAGGKCYSAVMARVRSPCKVLRVLTIINRRYIHL